MKLISITANIAAGKTSILNALEYKINSSDYIFLREPVDQWESKICNNGKSIFYNYCHDHSTWAYEFQLYVYQTRMDLITCAIKNNPAAKAIIIERSPDDDRFIFTQMLANNGDISKKQLDYIDNMRKEWCEISKMMYKILYIHTDVDECMRRIKIRGRSGEEENNIPREYLQELEKITFNWLETRDNVVMFENKRDQLDKLIDEIILFLTNV